MSKKRVVITGLGAISPIGNTVEETWQNALKGVSGIDLITKFDTTNFSVKFAAEVKNFKVADYIPALASVDGSKLGIAICTADGRFYSLRNGGVNSGNS